MPQPVREAVSLKHEQIKRADYGVTMAIEQIRGFAEGATGMLWPTATIKGSKTQELSGSFLDIVKAVEAYIEASGANRASDVMTYCYACQQLTHTHRTGPYACRDCKSPFV
jgi:hypothetical protein